MITVHKARQLGGVSVQLCCRGGGMLPSRSVVNAPNDVPRPKRVAFLIPFVWHLGLAERAQLRSGTNVRAELIRHAPCWD